MGVDDVGYGSHSSLALVPAASSDAIQALDERSVEVFGPGEVIVDIVRSESSEQPVGVEDCLQHLSDQSELMGGLIDLIRNTVGEKLNALIQHALSVARLGCNESIDEMTVDSAKSVIRKLFIQFLEDNKDELFLSESMHHTFVHFFTVTGLLSDVSDSQALEQVLERLPVYRLAGLMQQLSQAYYVGLPRLVEASLAEALPQVNQLLAVELPDYADWYFGLEDKSRRNNVHERPGFVASGLQIKTKGVKLSPLIDDNLLRNQIAAVVQDVLKRYLSVEFAVSTAFKKEFKDDFLLSVSIQLFSV